ncbi:MAG TPA: MAPEG family protein [Oceanospirillales bacterium]|nr:MAPEG family protein [Oceanospirillales bacterium]
MLLHITSLYAAILGLLLVFLAYKVVVFRRSKMVGMGSNGDKYGELAIRTHANATEYVPMLLILMAIYEANSGSGLTLHIIGVLAVIARVLHAFGLSRSAGVSVGRLYGTALTWIIIMILAALNIYRYII